MKQQSALHAVVVVIGAEIYVIYVVYVVVVTVGMQTQRNGSKAQTFTLFQW